ncbi:NF038215 family lipoprotein [uncultured Acinetobacter sp.]|uniref:NF038215 family lipoprotein n=1 Tax=uncultured Acinetobacter sp. TaxID=165433 RepID=UPI0025ECDD68|nr:NF038215 family lipoprotein [uncultured Acinetobacter sp.]
MNKLSIGLSIVLTVFLVGCEKKASTNPAKTEVRSIHIAGMPVYEKDYRLSTRENVIETER